jgi:hypothetical protein
MATQWSAHREPGSRAPTPLLFSLSFRVWPTINSGFEDLIFTLELVLEFIFKIPHLVGRRICERSFASFQSSYPLVFSICPSLRHCGQFSSSLAIWGEAVLQYCKVKRCWPSGNISTIP